jgi:hypothetical protein
VRNLIPRSASSRRIAPAAKNTHMSALSEIRECQITADSSGGVIEYQTDAASSRAITGIRATLGARNTSGTSR